MASQTVYIELLGEGVDVWRPVEAAIEANGIFRLPDLGEDSDVWRFPPGSRVRCATRRLYGGEFPLVTERVS